MKKIAFSLLITSLSVISSCSIFPPYKDSLSFQEGIKLVGNRGKIIDKDDTVTSIKPLFGDSCYLDSPGFINGSEMLLEAFDTETLLLKFYLFNMTNNEKEEIYSIDCATYINEKDKQKELLFAKFCSTPFQASTEDDYCCFQLFLSTSVFHISDYVAFSKSRKELLYCEPTPSEEYFSDYFFKKPEFSFYVKDDLYYTDDGKIRSLKEENSELIIEPVFNKYKSKTDKTIVEFTAKSISHVFSQGEKIYFVFTARQIVASFYYLIFEFDLETYTGFQICYTNEALYPIGVVSTQ